MILNIFLIAYLVAFILSIWFGSLFCQHLFQADAFANNLGFSKSLRAGLVKLQVRFTVGILDLIKKLYACFPLLSVDIFAIFQEENLSTMNTDPWYSTYHYSHPPLVERLSALDKAEKKTD